MARIRGRAAAIRDGMKVRMEMAAEAVRLTKETLARRQFEYDTVKAIYEQMEADLAPAPRQAKTTSKSTKKAGKKRAAVAATIAPNNDSNAHCQKEFAGGFVCDEPADANVHHLRDGTGYHEFESSLRNVAAAAGAGIQTADIGPLP